MKGLIFDIKHFAIHDGPGIRTTVFFKGCPMSCWWCHNPESQDSNPETIYKTKTLDGISVDVEETSGKYYTVQSLMSEIEKDALFYDESTGGVTFSGGEPLMQHDFLLEVLKMLKSKGIHSALDTCGMASQEALKKVLPYLDLVLFDIKLMNEDEHLKYTGVKNQSLLKNLELILQSNVEVILRFPLIPGITNNNGNIVDIKNYLQHISYSGKIDILPYHNIAKNKYQRIRKQYKLINTPEPSKEELARVKKEFEEIGLEVGIGG